MFINKLVVLNIFKSFFVLITLLKFFPQYIIYHKFSVFEKYLKIFLEKFFQYVKMTLKTTSKRFIHFGINSVYHDFISCYVKTKKTIVFLFSLSPTLKDKLSHFTFVPTVCRCQNILNYIIYNRIQQIFIIHVLSILSVYYTMYFW